MPLEDAAGWVNLGAVASCLGEERYYNNGDLEEDKEGGNGRAYVDGVDDCGYRFAQALTEDGDQISRHCILNGQLDARVLVSFLGQFKDGVQSLARELQLNMFGDLLDVGVFLPDLGYIVVDGQMRHTGKEVLRRSQILASEG